MFKLTIAMIVVCLLVVTVLVSGIANVPANDLNLPSEDDEVQSKGEEALRLGIMIGYV